MATRSLGSLTLDVIARVGGFIQGMDKSERASKKWRDQVEKDAKAIGQAVGLGTAAAVAGIGALVVSQVKYATELTKQAQLANTSVQEFQRYAVAADTAGISQEKLADQLKDFNEKVGEFQQTGAGGMKDFFDQIAPQVGITQEAFKGLSGAQGLQLYYDSLEKASLSQDQMSFYLESIASDTTALIPLLRNGGEGFKVLGDMAAAAGVIIDEKTLRSVDQLNAAVLVSQLATQGLKNQFSSGLLPVLGDMAVAFSDVGVEGSIAARVGESVGVVFKGIAAAAVGAYAGVELIGKGIATLMATVQGGKTSWYDWLIPSVGIQKTISTVISGENQAAKEAVADLDKTAQYYGEVINKIFQAGESGGADGENSKIAQVAELMRQMREQAEELRKNPVSFSVGGSDEELEKVLEFLKTEEQKLKDSYEERRKIILESTTQTEQEKANLILALNIKLNEDLARLKEDSERELKNSLLAIQQDLMTEEEKLTAAAKDRAEVLKQAYEAGLIASRAGLTSEQEYGRLLEENNKKLKEQIEDLKNKQGELDEFTKNAARSIQSNLSDAIVAGFDGGAGDLLDRWKDLLKRMVADALAADVTRAIFGQGALGGANGQYGTDQLFKGITGIFGGFFAGGGRPPLGKISVVGERGPELFIPDSLGTVIPNTRVDKYLSSGAALKSRGGTAGPSISIGNMNFPGVTNAQEARKAAGAAAREILAVINSSARYT